ncbi:hypothetical protein M434DRAFT_400255 [Hypoxylon sp. CO27-5]|nr:hypothetical protein M434DRAFT_400255 [Hypoxylon sp. CO27-5]
MSAPYVRHFMRLSSSLHLYRQAAIRPTKIIYHAGRIPHLRPLTSTPFRPAKVRVPLHRNTFAQVRFTLADVPPLSFWTSNARPPLIPAGEVSPDEFLAACRRYASLAIEDAPGWRQRDLSTTASRGNLGNDGTIPFSTLHYASILLMRSPAAGGHLATHILHTGVTLNYAPSVLTMARLGLKAGKLDGLQFSPAKEALERLASARNRDPHYRPDALTLMGLLHARQGTSAGDERALRFFGGASEAAAREPGAAWQWRPSAVLEQSRTYIRRKQADRAREVLRVAARELDNADVCFEYAMLLPVDDPERMPMLERAAVSGVEGAAREMGRIEALRAKEEGLSSAERREREVLADEWLGIAGDKALL